MALAFARTVAVNILIVASLLLNDTVSWAQPGPPPAPTNQLPANNDANAATDDTDVGLPQIDNGGPFAELTVEAAAGPRTVETIRTPPQKPTTLSTRPDERTTFSIPGTAPWTDTGLTLRVGDRVQLRAWGAVTFGDASRRSAMPRGVGRGGGCAFVVMDESVPAEALVANIAAEMTFDGRGFLVGSDWTGTLPVTGSTATEGRLFLGFNHGAMLCDRSGYDSWSFRNRNGGAFTVELIIWRASR